MVRKPENIVPTPLQQAVNNPPYPVSPTDYREPTDYNTSELPESSNTAAHGRDGSAANSPGFHEITHDEARSNSDDEGSINTDWDSGDEETEEHKKPEDLPAPLKVGGGKPKPETKPDRNGLPDTLRVGPPGGTRTRPPIPAGIDQPRQTTTPLQSQNPYLNMQTTGRSSQSNGYGAEDTNAIWGGNEHQSHVVAQQEPVELPSERTPVDELSKMSLRGDTVSEPKSPAVEQSEAAHTPKSPAVEQPGLLPVESKPATERHGSDASSAWDPGMDLSSLDAYTSRGHGLPSPREAEEPNTLSWQEQQAHERIERERREREAAEAQERAMQAEREHLAEEEWHRGEQAAREAAQVAPEPEPVPELPPRPSSKNESPPPKPPRPFVDVTRTGASSGGQDAESARTQEQNMSTYSIKHIRWFDARINSLREAPILTQNENGPCPLLALVNALVLSTPAGEQTALVETLRTREQVSLGLLLNAVFDELMSERCAGAAQELPDVGELYKFLGDLHTGMNVNPQFTGESGDLINLEPTDIHPLRHSDKAGGFEKTREMRLYSTFNVPLIHGWLPPSESRAYAAFDRVAKTYDAALNMQFFEEELEGKLSSQGLTDEEQKLYEDLHVIKAFFQTWPTQLTEHGLYAISQSLSPGSFAILFRNDHFSTVYKEPRSGKILTLVTDAGYSSHEEIVWESLVDINGKNSELYSGDFRPVSHHSETGAQGLPEPPIRSLLDDNDQGWTTVNNRNNRRNIVRENEATVTASGPQQTGIIPTDSPTTNISTISTTEQEDADLALALQLQEEEEDRHRRDQEARRRRENEASHSFLQNESQTFSPQSHRNSVHSDRLAGGPPAIPPRRSNNGNGDQNGVPGPRTAPPTGLRTQTTHRPTTENNAGEEPPPPTYEQAASGPAFQPPPGHPSSPTAPVRIDGVYEGTQGGGRGGRGGRGRGGGRRSSTPLIDQIPEGSGLGMGRGGVGRGAGGGRRVSAQGPGPKERSGCKPM